MMVHHTILTDITYKEVETTLGHGETSDESKH